MPPFFINRLGFPCFKVHSVMRASVAALLMACLMAQPALAQDPNPGADPAAIQHLLAPDQTQLDGHLLTTKVLRSFYASRNFKPLWQANLADAAQTILRQTAMEHGLPPLTYAVAGNLDESTRDVALTAAALRMGRDLSSGRIAPYRMVGGLGEETRPRFDGTAFLKELSQYPDLAPALSRLAPQSQDYQTLQAGLKFLRGVAASGGWPQVPDGPSLKPGESDPRIPILRKRLTLGGDLIVSDDSDDTLLDDALSAAIKLFQIRHGLDVDGAVGKRTIQAMNVPIEIRIHQVELALERIRQMPRWRENTRIDVNIAAQMLVLYESKIPTLEMRVVAGDVKHQTPTMATREVAITLNPTWTVPASIARKEILPKLKRDPNYLAHNNIHIVDPNPAPAAPVPSPMAENMAVAPSEAPAAQAIDWNKLGNSFPFVLRQVPGPDNALGRIKFNLQNQDAIYLHDTPLRSFFKRSYRLYSHGCIRLEHPLDLAQTLLGEEWKEKLQGLIDDGKTRTLMLKRPLPVYLLYLTAWVGADNLLYFRDDYYGNDQRLDAALTQLIP